MNTGKIIFITGLFIITVIINMYPMGQRIKIMPMKAAKLEIQDGEVLKYIKSGEGTISENEMHVVSKIRNDKLYGKVVDVYLGWPVGKEKKIMPSIYTNYEDKFTVSLNEASLIYNRIDDFSNNVMNNEKGIFYEMVNVNKTENIAEIETKSWNGNDILQSKSRVKIKPGFPVFDLDALAYVGARYLDIKGPGIVYILEPVIMKEPLPVSLRFIKNEVIDTPCGKFNTVKVGGVIADPFLGKLIKSYMDELFIWVENSERRLVVKIQSPSATWILESITNTKE